MAYDIVIRNGTVVTAEETAERDVAVEGEKIAAVEKNLPAGSGKREIDAKGKYVFPGGIDVHVHLQLPFCGTVSADGFASGTRAAARGGVTTLIDFAIQDAEKGLMAGIEARKKEADGNVFVDYGLHGIITKWSGAISDEMKTCISEGIPTFKMFMIYEKEGWQSDDAALYQALGRAKELGATIMVHAESQKVLDLLIEKYSKKKDEVKAYGHVLSRPHFIEEEAVQRAIKWAEVTGGTLYIVHMSSGGSADLVKAARQKGTKVFAETCPQYCILDDELFKGENGHLYATCPQIRTKEDNKRLWQGLAGGEISIMATDTCTFDTKQKAMWEGDFTKIPYGLPGVETVFPAAYTFGFKTDRFSLNRLVELTSANPAKFMGLYPEKGTIRAGSDADITIVSPDKTKVIDHKELATNCDWSPFQGMEMGGFPDITLSRGAVVVEDGAFTGKEGHGRFVRRKPGGWKLLR